jgi:hypothetical protein
MHDDGHPPCHGDDGPARTALEFLKRAATSTVARKANATTGPTPGTVGLREIARVLRAGGRVFVTDWCDDYIACWICDRALRLLDPAHRRAYGQKECRNFLVRAGFQIEALERYKIDWLWGLMTARAVSSGGQKS